MSWEENKRSDRKRLLVRAIVLAFLSTIYVGSVAILARCEDVSGRKLIRLSWEMDPITDEVISSRFRMSPSYLNVIYRPLLSLAEVDESGRNYLARAVLGYPEVCNNPFEVSETE